PDEPAGVAIPAEQIRDTERKGTTVAVEHVRRDLLAGPRAQMTAEWIYHALGKCDHEWTSETWPHLRQMIAGFDDCLLVVEVPPGRRDLLGAYVGMKNTRC